MLSIGMITCDRPGIDVHEAILRLRDGGFRQLVHLFCEPGTPAIRPLPNVVVHRNSVKRGVLGNWAHCLEWLVDHTSNEYLLVCEDDVQFAKGAHLAWEMDLDRAG